MGTGKRIFLIIIVILLLCPGSICALAAENMPDFGRKGSVTVIMKDTDTGETVSGGSLALYHVAELTEKDGGFVWHLTDAFSGCGISLEDIQSESLASRLAAYAEKAGTDHETENIGNDGKIVFGELKPGLYLVVQEAAAEEYYAIRPFLVSIPVQSEKGGWNYDVDASPKTEVTRVQMPPEAGGTSSVKPGSRLPQTGQLNWPVPVMTIAGLFLFSVGWILNDTKGKKDHEA